MKKLLLSFTLATLGFGQQVDWLTGIRNIPFVDARKYGAIGNGITDNTTFVQAAIDSVSSGQAVTIIFPPGTYLLNSSPVANGRYPLFIHYGESSTTGVGILPGGVFRMNRSFSFGPTFSPILGVWNSSTFTSSSFVDGNAINPQTLDQPSMIFQRYNATNTGNVSSAFVFHALNHANASPNFLAPVALTGAISDATIGRGGSAIRAMVYLNKPVFSTVVTNCTNTNPITVTVATPVPAYEHTLSLTITGVTGNTACNVLNTVPTFSNSTTFTIPVTGNGTYSGGGVTYVPISGYGLWISVGKNPGMKYTRLVGSEIDLNNFYADVPLNTYVLDPDGVYEADGGTVDATTGIAMVSAGFKNTIGIGFSGEPNAPWHYPLQFSVGSVAEGGTIIEARNANRIPGAGLRSGVSFAKIPNNVPIKYQSATFGASYETLNVSVNGHTILTGHPYKSIKIGPGQEVAYGFSPVIEVDATTARISDLQLVSAIEGTCDTPNAGRPVFIEGGVGVASTFRICGKNAAGVYSWSSLVTW